MPRDEGYCSVAGSMVALPSPSVPLSDDEYERLAGYLDDLGGLDIGEAIGLLNAVAVAPTFIHPSTWLPVILPEEELRNLGAPEARAFIGLLMRQYNEVVGALDAGEIVAPPADDIEECARFASGFAAGAELDAEWLADERWSLVVPLAYLGERWDLVPRELQAAFDADPNAKAEICANLIAVVEAAYEEFREARGAVSQTTVVRSGPKVGRNDVCPCGSGRKFKRCCGASQ